jgi:DNA-binding GntR family transcriptional regulator
MTLPDSVLGDFDLSGRVPVYVQLSEWLISAIATGGLPPGAPVASESQMARHLALSIPTVNQAITRLVDQGLLVRRRGIGTHVLPFGAAQDPRRYSAVPQCNSSTDQLEEHAS